MESADCTFCRGGMIILHEGIGDAELGEFFLIVGFHEESARVAKNLLVQFANARNRELIFLQRIHAFIGDFGPPECKILILQRPATFVRNRIERRISILVIFFVIGLIFAATHTGEPLGIGFIPCNRLAQPVIECDRRFPADFGIDLFAVEGVAAVVARTILHVCEQSFGLAHRRGASASPS